MGSEKLGKTTDKLMAVENFIAKNWNEQQKIFIKNVYAIRKKSTKKSVHDLRVSFKKLRSYLRLREKITTEAWKKKLAPEKKLFKISGKQRDIEMSLILLSNYVQKEKLFLPSFNKFLEVNKSLTQEWTRKAAIEFDVEQFHIFSGITYASLNSITDAEFTVKIREYAGKIGKEVYLLAKNINKNAHEIRKLFKDLYYWLIASPTQYPLEIKFVDKTLHYLGDWQDNFIFHKKLKHFRNEFLINAMKEFEAAKTAEKKIVEERKELLKKAVKQFRPLLKKVGKGN